MLVNSSHSLSQANFGAASSMTATMTTNVHFLPTITINSAGSAALQKGLLSDEGKPRQKRAYHKKVRTGCITCK